ncbi:hypothetical protein PV415_30125 [Streptomyces sp. ME03-5684b]|uniref:hypothetical protein n=1 Tax=Streptomyces sp. ME03-5684b TaxID=3028681 RepID=UPI0029AF6ACE|nr:hypothetical protein [Streptomyces sp. ME03-5684b]MDX3321170.1 hypothetical protein [Streptomyces sp. ME03-5684b]
MSQERRKLPLIAVYGEAGAKAEQRVTELLDAAGASPTEVHTLIAAIQAGAVEAAQGEVIELDTQAPSDSSDQAHEGWFRAVEAIAGRLAHIADRTVRQARTAASVPDTPPVVSRSAPNSLPTPVDSVGEDQVHDAAERSFLSLTGYAGFDRDLSEEILAVVLKSVSTEGQDGYARQVEAFAEANRERLGQLYGKYGSGGKFADESHCYPTPISPRASWSASAWTPYGCGSGACGTTRSTPRPSWSASLGSACDPRERDVRSTWWRRRLRADGEAMAQLKIRDLHDLLCQAPDDATLSRTGSASCTTAPACTCPRSTPRTP